MTQDSVASSFETWATAQGFDISKSGGAYSLPYIRQYFKGWQACSLAVKTPQPTEHGHGVSLQNGTVSAG